MNEGNQRTPPGEGAIFSSCLLTGYMDLKTGRLSMEFMRVNVSGYSEDDQCQTLCLHQGSFPNGPDLAD